MTLPMPLAVTAESIPSRRSSSPVLDTLLWYGVLSLLLFGPLAFGAVEAWSISTVQVGVGLLFALWATRQATAGKLEIMGSPLFLPLLLFGSLVSWQLATGQTAYRAATVSAAMLYCSYGLVLFLAVQCLRRTSQVKFLGFVLSGYGFTIAMLALLQGISSNGKLYWLRTPQSGGWIYGPYVNHNHYAGLMEMLTPIPLVISLASGVRGSRKTLAAVAAAVMASTIFLSGSRGGMVAFAAQMALLATFLIKRRRNWKAAVASGAFLVLAFGLLAWLGGGELVERMASIPTTARTELSGGTRLTIDRDASRMFAQKPVLGWGLGVFPEVYPQFSSFSSNIPVGMAHNDYLQVLVEMGALGFAAVLWFLLALYRSALDKLNHWPHDTNTTLTLAATLGVTGILVHSFVDFNLQIPANAALFYALCGVAAMEPRFGQHHHTRRNRSRPAEESSTDPLVAATVSIG